MRDKRETIMMTAAGVLPVIWLALKLAPWLNDGLLGIVTHMDEVFARPFDIEITESSLRAVLLCLAAYAIGIGIYLSMRGNYRRGEEHGSAKWGDPLLLNRRYSQCPYAHNKILTQNVRIGLNGIKHRRNLNVLVIGGSGSGKTRFYCKPNLMQTNTSFVVLDPKGTQYGILRQDRCRNRQGF